MAEVTKRKIASIYAVITGFILSLFSSHGHAQAGEFFTRKPTVEAGKTQAQSTATPPQTAGSLMAPAPSQTAGSLMAPAPAGSLMAPAPAQKAGSLMITAPTSAESLMSPAPAGAVTIQYMNAADIEDVGMQTFVTQKAIDRGIQTDRITESTMNELRTEYLLNQIKSLQEKVDQLQ